MSFCKILKFHLSNPSGCRVIILHSQTDYERTDGQMDKHGVNRTLTFNRLCNVLKGNLSVKNSLYVAKFRQKQMTISNSTLFQFLASLSPIPGTTENATFAHFMKNSYFWRLDFCQIKKSHSYFRMDYKSKKVYSLIDWIWSIYDVRRWWHFDFALYL